MMIIDEIKEHFAAKVTGLRVLNSLPDEFVAFTIRTSEYYGVAVMVDPELEISENSADSRIYTTELSVNGYDCVNFLILCCFNEQFRLPFAQLCEHFVEPGAFGKNRRLITEDTLTWWNKWIGLLGNCRIDRQVYSIIAEMLALRHVFARDKSAKWTAEEMGSHDIETDTRSIEVKASIVKSATKITVHSQFQLSSEKDMDLFFCRLEASNHGISINHLKQLLIEDGYDKELLDSQLRKFGLDKGASICDQRYVVLEQRRYLVDDKFPKITQESFKNDVFPNNITKIVYDIDLEGLPYTTWSGSRKLKPRLNETFEDVVLPLRMVADGTGLNDK